MLVFAISITPRQFLHDFFAGHIDTSHHCNADGKTMGCLHTAGYSCQLDSPVVNNAYYSPVPDYVLQILPVYSHQYALLFTSFPSSLDNVKESRGPPPVA
ncbi:MAG: hypothetical protein ABIW38_11485 [Ferruginibacter sp.]